MGAELSEEILRPKASGVFHSAEEVLGRAKRGEFIGQQSHQFEVLGVEHRDDISCALRGWNIDGRFRDRR